MSVCFQVNVYDKTIDGMVDTRIEYYLNSFIGYEFKEKFIVVNNISDRKLAEDKLQKFSKEFKIIFVESQDIEKIYSNFGLKKEEILSGFNYSAPHYVTLYHTTSDYVLHISEDIEFKKIDKSYIEDSIEYLEKSDDYISSMPKSWAGSECLEIETDLGMMYTAKGWSDQMFILKTKIFKKCIYNYKHSISNRYPIYGGECFEKRIDSYMMIENKFRLIHKINEYKHLK